MNNLEFYNNKYNYMINLIQTMFPDCDAIDMGDLDYFNLKLLLVFEYAKNGNFKEAIKRLWEINDAFLSNCTLDYIDDLTRETWLEEYTETLTFLKTQKEV